MGRSVNKVSLLGNLGADPEIRYTKSGQPVAGLRLATTDTWKDRDGNQQESTEWHSISVWGAQAELCGKYLQKGRQVYIEGSLQTREYTDRDGNPRKATEVKAREIVFLGGGERAQGGGRDQSRGDTRGGYNQNQGGGYGGGRYGQNQNHGGGWHTENQGGGYGQGPADNGPHGGGHGQEGIPF